MPLPENPPGDTPIKPAEDKGESKTIELLHAEVRSLRILFNILLLALIVLAASLFIFMRHERKLIRRQFEDNSRYIADYQRKMTELNSKLFAYSKLHTNFTPIYVRYFGATNLPSAPGPTSALPTTPLPGLGTQPQPSSR